MPMFERPVALMMPIVTVWLSWNGLPTATTYSPTSALAESPQESVGRPPASTFTTAMSVTGSVPTSVPRRRWCPAVALPMRLACSIPRLLVTMAPPVRGSLPLPLRARATSHLGQLEAEDAVAQLRAHVSRLDLLGELEGAQERPVASLHPVEAVRPLAETPPLALHGERVAVHLD